MDRNPNIALAAQQNASFYDELWRTLGRELHYSERMRVDFIVAGLREHVQRTDCRILDFGCGRGWMAPFLSQFGKVVGVDFSAVGIHFAREHFGESAEFLLADPLSETLGLPQDAQFDVVLSSEVIEHVEDAHDYIRQVRRFSKPEGWLILTTPNGNVWSEYTRHRRLVHTLQPVENWLQPSRLSQIVRAEGYVIVLHEGRPLYDYRFGHHRWLQRRLVHRLSCLLGLEHRYGNLLLMDALHQVLIARLR